MALQKGDFILIDYVAKVKETNEVFDTTKEDVAKKEHQFKEGELYEPKLVVLGENWVLKTLDEELTKMEVDKPQTIEIPSDKAFGPRDPNKIQRVPIKQLYAKEINPVVGARIEFQNKNATVRSVGAGRVLLDYNPPLAGRSLIYEVKVTKKIEGAEAKVSALIHRRVPVVEQDKFKLSVEINNLTIDLPEDTFYVEGIQIAKRGIAMDIQKFLPEIEVTKFVETFKSEPKPVTAIPTTPAAEVKPTETAPAEDNAEKSAQKETAAKE